MASEAWHWYTPFLPRIEDALAVARRDAFQHGAYRELWDGGGPVANIDELRQRCANCDTASVIDIQRTARGPAPRAVSPFSPDVLEEHFGTAAPTRLQLDGAYEQLLIEVAPGEGRYIILHDEAGNPTEILFFGRSSD